MFQSVSISITLGGIIHISKYDATRDFTLKPLSSEGSVAGRSTSVLDMLKMSTNKQLKLIFIRMRGNSRSTDAGLSIAQNGGG